MESHLDDDERGCERKYSLSFSLWRCFPHIMLGGGHRSGGQAGPVSVGIGGGFGGADAAIGARVLLLFLSSQGDTRVLGLQ